MRLFLDTNIVFDYLLHRSAFYKDSRTVVLLGCFEETENFISASTVTDINYFLKKEYGSSRAQEIIETDLSFLKLAPVTQNEIASALKRRWTDFEDAVVAACAETINADFIVTRNQSDFKLSKIRALSPTEMLQWFESNNIVYEAIDFINEKQLDEN